MNQKEKIDLYKESAADYDRFVREYNSYCHDVLFGMSFDFVKKNEKLLDIGIGTGLASIPFSRIGLKVYGLDSSQEMLHVCESKSFAQELRLLDMTCDQIPFEDHYFNHVVCCGAIHFVGDLNLLFPEIKRVMKRGGMFSFTISPQESKRPYVKEDTSWGMPIYKHSLQYIMDLLDENGFLLHKEQRLLTKGEDKRLYNMLFSVLVAEYH